MALPGKREASYVSAWVTLGPGVLAPPLPSLVGAQPGLHFPSSQLPKRKLPWALRPLNANSRLPEPGWSDVNLPDPFSLGSPASYLEES